MRFDYELLDVVVDSPGGGRKRERFGKYVVDRPAVFNPKGRATHSTSATAGLPSSADFVYQRESESSSGHWLHRDGSPVAESIRWTVVVGQLTLELRLTDSGQLGLFPEQADNWQWIAQQIARLTAEITAEPADPPRVLNLFAYTGASTLAAAAAGAHVVHVDSARPVVQWARRNAELSGLSASPLRWLVEAARAFVRRELRRQRRYQGVVLDPPSYGHGVKGHHSKLNDWRLERDLPEILADCRRLLDPERAFMLLTCHTTGVTREELARWFEHATGWKPAQSIDLALTAATGASLPSGVCVRWVAK